MIEVPNDAYTLSGFRAWVASLDEHGPRVSFARGIVHVETSAQSQETHEPVAAAINVVLSSLDIGRYFMPPSWFTHEASALSTEPDGFFALWSTLEQGDLRLNPEREIEMLGRPDMVLEVVSKTSHRKDLVEHPADYALAGVREYWIADARTADTSLRILTLGAEASYVDVQPDPDGWLASPLWQRAFRLRQLPERAGLRDYSLDVREAAPGAQH